MSTKTVYKLIKAISKGKVKLNVCELSNQGKLQGFKLIPKTSASYSEVAFGKLMLCSIEKKVIDVSLKIFLDNFNLDGKSLKYEVAVYKYIVDTILSNNYSPNFISYLGYGSCSIDTVRKIIHDIELLPGNNISDTGKINILMTEKPKGKLQSFNDCVYNIQENEVIKIMFQIIYSLNVMSKFRLNHNDLHEGNILVATLDSPITRLYVVGDKRFLITTRYIPYLFDWDFSYAEPLGDNPKEKTVRKRRINVFKSRADLYTLLCSSDILENYPKIMDFLEKSLYTDLFNRVEEQSKSKYFNITGDEIKRIQQYRPYTDNMYRMSGLQLKSIVPSMDEFINTNKIHTVTFTIYNNKLLELYQHTPCRLSNISSLYPTPEEVLLSDKYNLFNDLEVKTDEEYKVPTFTTPRGISKRIYIDPKIPSTRHLLRYPKFPVKTRSGYIKGTTPKHVKTISPVDFRLPLRILNDKRRITIYNWLYDISKELRYDILVVANAITIIDYMLIKKKLSNNELRCYAISAFAISTDIYIEFSDMDEFVEMSKCTKDVINKYIAIILDEISNPQFYTIANYIYDYMNGNITKEMERKIVWIIMNGTVYENNAKVSAKKFLMNPKQFTEKKPKWNTKLLELWMV